MAILMQQTLHSFKNNKFKTCIQWRLEANVYVWFYRRDWHPITTDNEFYSNELQQKCLQQEICLNPFLGMKLWHHRNIATNTLWIALMFLYCIYILHLSKELMVPYSMCHSTHSQIIWTLGGIGWKKKPTQDSASSLIIPWHMKCGEYLFDKNVWLKILAVPPAPLSNLGWDLSGCYL